MHAPRHKAADKAPAAESAPKKAAQPTGVASRPPAWINGLPLQPKLTVNQPGDLYEQEADAMAEQVMRMPAGSTGKRVQRCACGGTAGPDGECEACKARRLALQRKGDSTGGSEAPQSVHQTLNRPGQPLDDSTRDFMESRFGSDFSGVRVHTDSQAAQSTRDVSARAYTVGSDVVFGAGQYAPGTEGGKSLLAHELTHVVQQNEINDSLSRKPKKKGKLFFGTKRPKLSLYQDTGETDGKFFRIQANKKAREVGTISFGLDPECPVRVETGSIPYKTGADIVEAVAKAYWCTGDQVKEVHIFGHSGSSGMYGVGSFISEYGLYSDTPSSEDQAMGGRAISDIPTEALAPDIVFVLHGCSAAAGDDSFAEILLKSILGTSPKAKVYGHQELGMCGRNQDWREFSSKNPEGKVKQKNPYGLKKP